MTDKKNNVHVFNDFLAAEDFKIIQNLLLSDTFPWYYNNRVVNEDEDNDDYFQFTHNFFHDVCHFSSYFDVISPILEMLSPISLLRIKSNLLTKTEKNIEHGFHVDFPNLKENQHPTTAILYINTNNGYTKFEDGSIIESVENRLVMFNSRLSHTGASCTDEKTRVVINFNYF
jgi:hypothetical protein